MKKIFNLFAFAAIAALTLAGCSKNDQDAPEKDAEKMHITVKANVQNIKADPGTKTYIDTYNGTPNTILWGTGEYMKIAVQGTEETVFAKSSDGSADTWDGEPEAMFEFSLTAPTGTSYKYMGLYPESAAVANNNTKPDQYKVNLPNIQNATASSYDPAAYIMVAKPEIKSSFETVWEASYRRATALNKITLTNISEDIESVEITADDDIYLAGRRYFNLTTGESGAIYYNQTETIVVEYSTHLSASTDKVVWFTSWGAEIPVGKTLKIVATGPTNIYTRTLTVTGKPITFKEGYLNTLKVNMSSAEVTSRSAAKVLPYTESFAASIGDFSTDGEQVANTDIWQFDSDHGYMKATAYISGTNYNSESWLISPWIDLTSVSAAYVTFDHVQRYTGTASEELTLWVMTNVPGASWQQVTIPHYSTGGNWTFVNSGEILLNSFVGNKVKVGFKYTSSTTAAGTWEIKNFNVAEKIYTTEFTMDNDEISVEVGKSTNNNVTVNSGATITYDSDDETIAIVDADGTVTGVSAGTTYINVHAAATGLYPAADDLFEVTVTPAVTYKDFTWDLSTNHTSSATSELISWYYRGMVMSCTKGNSDANYYYGGDANNRTSTRFSNNSTLTISPYSGCSIGYVEFTATSASYANTLKNSAWTNATASVDGTIVTVTPTTKTNAFSAAIGGVCGFTSVKVYYTGDLEAIILNSIAVSGQTTSFNVGDDFEFGGTVTATYSDASTAEVTSSATFSGYDMSTTGEQTVTVTYTEGGVTKTTKYGITVYSGGGGTPTNYSENFTGQTIGGASSYGSDSWTHTASATSWTATDVSTALSNLSGNSKHIAIKGNGSIVFTGTNGITALSFDYLKPTNAGNVTVTVNNGVTDVYSETTSLNKGATGTISITSSDFSSACPNSFTVTISTTTNSLQINTVSWTSAK